MNGDKDLEIAELTWRKMNTEENLRRQLERLENYVGYVIEHYPKVNDETVDYLNSKEKHQTE